MVKNRLLAGTALMSLLWVSGTGASGLLAFSASAYAQSETTTSAATTTIKQTRRGPELEQIVVTAQRRKQTLQEVPLTVTFISPQTTKNLDVRTIHDVGLVTPSLSFSSQVDFDQVFIRGIGSNYANPGLESPVAIYQDGVYTTASNNSVLALLDPAGVQVLSGPQGTLYGRNASGGVILVDTANPTNKAGGSIQTEGGMYGHFLTDVILNMPITPDLRIRFAGRIQHDGGYIHNLYNNHSIGGQNGTEGRVKIDYTPSEVPGLDVTASFDASYAKVSHDLEAETLQAPACLLCIPALGGAKPPTGFYNTNQNDGHFIERSIFSYVRVNYVAGPITYTSLTGFHSADFVAYQGSDQDYTPVNFFSFHSYAPGKTLSEDLTLQTNYGGPLNFLVGLSYLNDRRAYTSKFFGNAFAGVDANGLVPVNTSSVLTKSVSGFIQATYKFTDKWSLQAGARYNVDHRDLTSRNNAIAQEVFIANQFAEQASFYSFTPSGVLTYKSPIGDAYISYTKGFKAGGFNTPAFTESPKISPEKIQSEEIGLKSRFFGGRLTTNIDAFHYKDNGLQVNITCLLCGGSITKNAGSSEGYGTEMNGRFAVTNDLIIGFGGDYLHAQFDRFENAAVYCLTPGPASAGGGFLIACPAGSPYSDLNGKVVPHAPKFTGFLTAEYSFPIFPGFKASLAGALHYTTGYDFQPGANGQLGLDKQSGYALLNINGWLTPDSEKYRVGFYLDNATFTKYNDYYATSAPYGAYHQAAAPIAFGVKLQYNFGEF